MFPRVGQCQDQSLAPERGYQKERYIFEHTNTINWSIEVDYVTIGRRYGPSANICDSEVWRLFASRTWGLLPFGTVLNYSSQLEFRSDVAKRLYMRVAFQSCLLCLCAYLKKMRTSKYFEEKQILCLACPRDNLLYFLISNTAWGAKNEDLKGGLDRSTYPYRQCE